MRAGATPVLIPNTTVKTCTADGTILETVWKSRWLPDLFIKHLQRTRKCVTLSTLMRGPVAQQVRARA